VLPAVDAIGIKVSGGEVKGQAVSFHFLSRFAHDTREGKNKDNKCARGNVSGMNLQSYPGRDKTKGGDNEEHRSCLPLKEAFSREDYARREKGPIRGGSHKNLAEYGE